MRSKFGDKTWQECDVFYKVTQDPAHSHWCDIEKGFIPAKGKMYRIYLVEKVLTESVPDPNLFAIDQDLWNAIGHIFEVKVYLESIMEAISISCFHANKSKE